MTDGHTRTVTAHLARWDNIPVYWDEDELDMNSYGVNDVWKWVNKFKNSNKHN